MGASSTRKGKVGEREWANWLREHLGATVSRGQQGGGGHNDPDVKGLAGWWCEVKRVERFSVWKVLETLLDDWLAGATRHDKPMVAFRRNRGKWWVLLRAEDWAGLLKDRDQARLDAGIWERRVVEAAEAEELMTADRDRWKAQAKAMAAELDRTAR